MKIASAVLFALACSLLYYGTAELFFVPRHLHESYFARDRVLYGVLPTLASGAVLVVVGWLWARSRGLIDFRRTIIAAIRYAIGAVVLFWVGLIIVSDLRQG